MVARRIDRPQSARLEKRHIVEKIISALRQDFEAAMNSARVARADATDEQSKAENKYDTRGLEASYLARGQSIQAAETIRNIALYEGLALREFAPGEPIEIGALIELEQNGERSFCFLGPGAGGTEVECEGANVLVLNAQSPLGKHLLGRKAGDRFEVQFGRDVERFHIVSLR